MGRADLTPGYWAVIPAQIRYDDQIPANAKLLYAEISSLTGRDGYCWADNAYFAGLYRMTERSIRRLLDALQERGYIRVEEERENHNVLTRRRIYAGLNPLAEAPEPLDKNVRPLDKKVQRHIIEQEILSIPPISPAQKETLDRLPKEAAAALLNACGEDGALLGAWLEFARMRREKRSPIKTVRTVELLAAKLEKLSGRKSEKKIAILEQSVENSWTGLFALKGGRAIASDGGGYWAEDPEAV